MQTRQTPMQRFLSYVLRPHKLLQASVEYGSAWIFTRKWLSALVLVPALVLTIAAIGLASWGYSIENRELVKRYMDLADAEISSASGEGFAEIGDPDTTGEDEGAEESADGSRSSEQDSAEGESGEGSSQDDDSLLAEADITNYGELLLRRVLQLETSNVRATYFVAVQMAKNGRLGQARAMMRSIAPKRKRGIAAAHAWLAVDALSRGVETQEEKKDLLNDLGQAMSWSGTGVQMITLYADLLEKENRVNDALVVLKQASSRSDSLKLKRANMAAQYGRERQLLDAIEDSKEGLLQAVASDEPAIGDFVGLANIQLLENDIEAARRTVIDGLRLNPNEERLKRLHSESWRKQYRKTLAESGGRGVPLGLLENALLADPTNEGVGIEIARLIAFGRDAEQEGLREALDEQIADGRSTALTHIFLAESEIAAGNLKKAVQHYELALRRAPGNQICLNNLGYAIALTDKNRLDEALAYIDQAVNTTGLNQTLPADSQPVVDYLDSQGRVRAMQGDHQGAVDSFERALGIHPDRRETREQLAAAYDALGLPDMAKLHRDKLKAVENE